MRANPQAGVSSLLAANPGLVSSFQLAAVRATLPAFFPAGSGHPWGYQDPTQWNAYGQWMLSQHLITNTAALARRRRTTSWPELGRRRAGWGSGPRAGGPGRS